MALVFWSAEFVRPADRGLPENTRSDMHYAATRKGVQPLRETERPASMSSREGLQYIANRRGVQAFDAPDGDTADGLFNADGKADLQEEIRKLEAHPDCTEWRGIISFKKADLRRIGYDDPEAMRGLLRARMPDVAKQYGISPENLVWNAAYHPVDKHGDDHHPHYHVYFYSTDPAEGNKPAPPSRLEKARSILTNDLFRNDLSEIQTVGREARATLQEAMEAWPPEQLAAWEIKLHHLHGILPQTGKMTYAFLPAAAKKQVDTLLREWIAQPGIASVYDRLKSAQRRYVAAYNDDPDKIERRMAEWEKHFYHPTGQNDRATLHNRIIRLAQSCAAEAPLPPAIEPESEVPEKEIPVREYTPEEKRAYRLSKLANEWYRGDKDAGLWLSRMLRRERPDVSAYVLKSLADQGYRPAIYELSRHEDDPLKKLRMLRESAGVDGAAAARDPKALYDLAKHYEWALDNRGEAVTYYEMAADQNYDAALRLATIYNNPDMDEEGLYDPDRAAYWRESAYAQLQNVITAGDTDLKNVNYAQLQLGYLYQQSGEMYNAAVEYGGVLLRQAAHPETYDDELMQRAYRALARIDHHPKWNQMAIDQTPHPDTEEAARRLRDGVEAYAAYMAQNHVPEWQRRETWHLTDQAPEIAGGLYRRFEHRSVGDLLRAFDSPAPWMGFSRELQTARHKLRLGDPEALALLRAEDGANNDMAALELAQLYEMGQMVEKDAAASERYYARARDLLKAYIDDLAEHQKPHDPYAEYRLGELLLDGKGGAADVSKGLEWLDTASDHGSARASLELGKIHEQGSHGQSPNRETAEVYYRHAVAQLRRRLEKDQDDGRAADPWTECRLGCLLWDGKGCTSNPGEGFPLLTDAALQGYEPARAKLSEIYIPKETLQSYAVAVRTIDALSPITPEQLPDQARDELRQTTQQLMESVHPELHDALQRSTEERFLRSVHYQQVSRVISGIYATARTRPEEYSRLAACIRLNAAPTSLSPEALKIVAQLMTPIAPRIDAESQDKMVAAVLSIAVQKRMQALLDEPSVRAGVARETGELQELMRRYGCTRYRDDLPDPVQRCLDLACDCLTTHHDEFAACAATDQKRWRQLVFSAAEEQLLIRNQTRRFSRSGIAEMLFIAQSVGHMAAQATRQNEQPNRDPKRDPRQSRRDRRRFGQRPSEASEQQESPEIAPESMDFGP